ncbi:M23 family metallopeptidase [Thiocystis minor]|uniref:M23 family metallopeptidase n=1 Tax=Thiocystis minor TaxID=61597 RepID=UPI001912D559|nr:M23 family metallopeptidase [Thiocystis minor]
MPDTSPRRRHVMALLCLALLGLGVVEAGTQTRTAPAIRLITQDSARERPGLRMIHARAASETRVPVRADPVQPWNLWPVSGRISSGYGLRRHPLTHRRQFHHGIDLAVPLGTPIRAVAAGRVSFSGWSGGYGQWVELDHGEGWTSRYAHGQTRRVQVGQRVQAGETLATVGATGMTTGPHLHFEIRHQGASLDPIAWLPAAPAGRLAASAW